MTEVLIGISLRGRKTTTPNNQNLKLQAHIKSLTKLNKYDFQESR